LKAKLLCATVIAVGVSFWAGPSAMGAINPSFEPLRANIPYLAWRGEELRLVKCVTNGNDGIDIVNLLSATDRRFNADWLVEDWSGQFFQPPQLEASTVTFFRGNNEYNGAPCVKADFVSLKAGLAQIKLVISDARTGNPVLKHQFLAGWLGLNTPTIRELAATSVPGGGGVLGDPAGDGILFAGGAPGRVQVQVTGNLPLGNNFTELRLPASINLPTEADGVTTYWDDLARAMATTADPRPFYRDAPWRMWDIHDDRLATEGHVNTTLCGTPLATIDAVDACLGAAHFIGDGRYSRVFGDLSGFPTYGPFDPLRPDETLVPDGKLDDGDVPMPSAIVEVGITPNTGAPTDIGGVGSLAVIDGAGPRTFPFLGVFKCIPYTRDHSCNSNGVGANKVHPPTIPNVVPTPLGAPEHNHYAPYYSRWIPATFATVDSSLASGASIAREASGNDGPPIGNNFPGYRTSGLYDYWQFVDVLTLLTSQPTTCLGSGGQFRRTPEGPQRVLVLSDEHGEAQVYFNPGLGFFFDRLGVGPNLNRGCDLRDVTNLGFADIQAIARYPYQKVTDSDKPSSTIRKVVRHRFRKDVVCVPKGPVPPIENSLAFICTATAIDIDGSPIVGEEVCFTAGGPGSELLFEFPVGTQHTRLGDFTICIRTNSSGQASVEVIGKCGTGNVFAFFKDEGLLRVATFTFGCPTGGGTTTTTTPTTAAAGTPSGVTGSVATGGGTNATGGVPAAPPAYIAQLVQQGGATPESKPASKPAKATLAVARIQKKAFAGKSARYIMVRVNASASKARIQVTLVARGNRVIGKITRVVPTNRLVRVPNLKVPARAVAVRVKVLS
jgi:hypothetical protein